MTSRQHPRRRAVVYRISPDTREKLEALKCSLGEDATQADAVEYLLAFAEVGRIASEHLGVRPGDLPGRLTEFVEQSAKIAELHLQIAELQTKVGDLQHQLQHTQAATQPAARPLTTGNDPGSCAPCGSFRW